LRQYWRGHELAPFDIGIARQRELRAPVSESAAFQNGSDFNVRAPSADRKTNDETITLTCVASRFECDFLSLVLRLKFFAFWPIEV
jgi:hypothetical protein